MTFPATFDPIAPIVNNVTYPNAAFRNPYISNLNGLIAGAFGDYNKVVVVSKQGDRTTLAAGVAAASALLPSPTNKVLIYAYPGIYENEIITLPNHVSIIGHSRESVILSIFNPGIAYIIRTSQNNTIQSLTLKRAGVSQSDGLITLNALGENIVIRDCSLDGGGPGTDNANGEITVRLVSGGKLSITDCTIANPGAFFAGPLKSVITILNTQQADIVIERVSITNATYPIDINGVEFTTSVSNNNVRIKDCTILVGNGTTTHSVASVAGTWNAYAINNSFRVPVQAGVGITEHNNFVDAGQVI